MDRTILLRQLYVKELDGMRHEIAELLASPAQYLDAALTAEPTTGIELYERYLNLRARVSGDLPELIGQTSGRPYQASIDGSLLRPDLQALARDIEALARLIAEST